MTTPPSFRCPAAPTWSSAVVAGGLALLAIGLARPAAASEPPATLARLHLSDHLHALGRQLDDPVLLIAAARLALSTPLRLAPLPDPGSGPSEAEPLGPDAAAMLEEAREAAGGDLALLRFLDVVPAVPPVVQARVMKAALAPGDTLVVAGDAAGFRADADWAELRLRGAPSVDMDLAVLTEAGAPVCRSGRAGPNEYCAWSPARTGPVRIEVRNLGPHASRLELTAK